MYLTVAHFFNRTSFDWECEWIAENPHLYSSRTRQIAVVNAIQERYLQQARKRYIAYLEIRNNLW